MSNHEMHRPANEPEPFDGRERIVADPRVLVGKPVVKGTRLAVAFIVELLAGGWSFDESLANYPGLTAEDIALPCGAVSGAGAGR